MCNKGSKMASLTKQKHSKKVPYSVCVLLRHILNIMEYIKETDKYVPNYLELSIVFDKSQYNEILEFTQANSAGEFSGETRKL